MFIFDTDQTFSFSLDDLDVDIWDNGIIVKVDIFEQLPFLFNKACSS